MGQGTSPAVVSRGGRITVTVLVLVIPGACLALALTDPRQARDWAVIGLANLVLPAVLLPFVWRRRADPSPTTQP